MFVTQKRYDRLLRQAAQVELARMELESRYHQLAHKWNELVARVNSGELVPKSAAANGTFSPGEIETLVRLCHPDKHGGSKSANDMTARLLALRKAG